MTVEVAHEDVPGQPDGTASNSIYTPNQNQFHHISRIIKNFDPQIQMKITNHYHQTKHIYSFIFDLYIFLTKNLIKQDNIHAKISHAVYM